MTVAKRPTGLEGGRADMKRFAPPPALVLPRPADPTLDPGRPALAQLLGWRRGEVSYKGSVTHTVPLSKKISLQCKAQYSTVRYSTVRYSTGQYSTVQYSTVQYSTVQYRDATAEPGDICNTWDQRDT